MANMRPFSYSSNLAQVSVETAKDSKGNRAYVEFTSSLFVNVGFDTVVSTTYGNPSGSGWVSIERGKMLDDLITALTYYRDEGYKELVKK